MANRTNKVKRAVQKAVDRIKAVQNNGDIEMAHVEADEALCELLQSLGFDEVVDEWYAVDKWYA